MNVTAAAIKGTIKVICKVVIYTALIDDANKAIKNIAGKVRYSTNVKYSDAIDAIVNSKMFDSRKTEAIELLKKGEDAEYYKAIIKIVNSNMFDSNKIIAITNLDKEEEA